MRCLAVGAFAAACFLQAEEWSRFRGPNGSGVSTGAGFPVEFGRARNLTWRTPVRPGKSSPVLTGRRVFLTAHLDGTLYTSCFDRKSGKLLWERAEARVYRDVMHTLNDPASITPVTDGENVYVFFADLGLLSYDANGKLRWKVPLGPFTNMMGVAASPILAGGLVVVVVDQQDDSYIAGFDARNGELRWKAARGEQHGWATPVAHGSEILTVSRGQLGAHRLADGARSWSYNRLSPAIVASPVLVEDTIYTFGYGNDDAAPFTGILSKYDKNNDGVVSREEQRDNAFLIGIGRYDGNRDGIIQKDEWDEKQRSLLAPSSLLAVRLERGGGRELWRYERSFVGVIPSPLVYSGVLYVIKNGGILTAFDAGSGEVLKAARVPGAVSGYSSSPVAADGKVFLASEDGKVAVLRAGRDWDVLAVNDLGEPCYATPALSSGRIYLRTADALYSFGLQ